MSKIVENSIFCKDKIAVWKDLKEEGIILNLNSGYYFNINETGVFIWKLLDGRKSLRDIALKLSVRYKIPKKVALKDVALFTKSLYSKKLISFSFSL